MNLKFLLFVSLVGSLTACSSAYKSGQTPDDVYYSPAREQDSYAEVEDRRDRYQAQRYDDYVNDFRNDRFLRMSLRNRLYMPTYDDFFWNDWRFGLANNWNNPWNSYFSWNSFYNPYCVAPVFNGNVINRNPIFFKPSANNITYSVPSAPRSSPRYQFTRGSYSSGYLTPGSGSRTSGSGFRKVLSSIESSSSSSGATRSDRTISSGSSSGSSSRSSSSGSSSSGSVSRPGRN